MTLKQIAGLGRQLVLFLGLFGSCFHGRKARKLLEVCVQGNRSRGTVPMFAAGRAGGAWKYPFRREHGTVPFGPGGEAPCSPLCR
jgi:hypothetical protein